MPNRTILHLTGMVSTKYGGIERYLLEVSRLCRQRGYRTVLQYEMLPESRAYLGDLERLGAVVVPLQTRLGLLPAVLRLARLVTSVRPEVVQLHFGSRYVRFIAPVLARVLGSRKAISMVHTVPNLKKNSPRRFALNQYDHVLGVSQAVTNNLLEVGVKPNLLSTHYLGLFGKREFSANLRQSFRKEFLIPNEATVLACIAFDDPVKKGLDVLLETLRRIVSKDSLIHLIMIGIDPASSTLPEHVTRLGLSDQVHWAGIRDQGWQILNAADVYIQPSRSEGLPLAIMEAMALKLPVISSKVDGIPEAVIHGETGFLAEPGSVDSLTETIECMLANSARWKEMGEAGYRRYRDLFDGEKSVEILVEKYFQLRTNVTQVPVA